jgi:hypothetical protein
MTITDSHLIPSAARAGVTPGYLAREAEAFIDQMAFELDLAVEPVAMRKAEILADISRTGTYVHTGAELDFGAKVAWRNHTRCIGKLFWRTLVVRDRRNVSAPGAVSEELTEHLRIERGAPAMHLVDGANEVVERRSRAAQDDGDALGVTVEQRGQRVARDGIGEHDEAHAHRVTEIGHRLHAVPADAASHPQQHRRALAVDELARSGGGPHPVRVRAAAAREQRPDGVSFQRLFGQYENPDVMQAPQRRLVSLCCCIVLRHVCALPQ